MVHPQIPSWSWQFCREKLRSQVAIDYISKPCMFDNVIQYYIYYFVTFYDAKWWIQWQKGVNLMAWVNIYSSRIQKSTKLLEIKIHSWGRGAIKQEGNLFSQCLQICILSSNVSHSSADRTIIFLSLLTSGLEVTLKTSRAEQVCTGDAMKWNQWQKENINEPIRRWLPPNFMANRTFNVLMILHNKTISQR